ncbi:SRPBCC family protein [Mycolicibacterium sp. 050232]|uniref:SRPBCC family protein n=1 Tax=Mycolicibacterium sp. 050232 TaxID=3113982 RepID=UPI002E2A3FFB|nr:SRPBCC family protein [Mycolicibacterium sp. 050232]MED5810840.1 SRPBCC family protein [Mycolicibacterium sp. 050232]
MPTIVITKHIDAPAVAVWALLADFGNVKWIPVAGRVDTDGQGVGMRRLIYGSGDSPAVETLTGMDADRMILSYRITNNPLPVSRFEAVVTLDGHTSTDTTTITWSVDYDPAQGTTAEAAHDTVESVYAMIAGWLGEAAALRG